MALGRNDLYFTWNLLSIVVNWVPRAWSLWQKARENPCKRPEAVHATYSKENLFPTSPLGVLGGWCWCALVADGFFFLHYFHTFVLFFFSFYHLVCPSLLFSVLLFFLVFVPLSAMMIFNLSSRSSMLISVLSSFHLSSCPSFCSILPSVLFFHPSYFVFFHAIPTYPPVLPSILLSFLSLCPLVRLSFSPSFTALCNGCS